MLLLSSVTTARRRPAPPAGVMHRAVDIWSEGTRMAGDLYWPATAGDQRLPAIVMRHGWGGKKAGLVRNAVTFAADGFVVFAFDYRGWGESDGKLVVIGDLPERGNDSEVQILAREIHGTEPYHDRALSHDGPDHARCVATRVPASSCR